MNGSEWFWGGEFSPAEQAEIEARYDRVLRFDTAIALLGYDRLARVCTLHVFLEPQCRGTKDVARLIAAAVSQAARDGMQKILAPLIDGSPFLKPNRPAKFGFIREGILKRQAFIAGKLRDVHLYAYFLEPIS